MTSRERKILLIDFLRRSAPRQNVFDFGGIRFSILEHSIGWDFDTAEALVRRHDGFVDGIALSGLRRMVAMGKTRVVHGPSMRVVRAAHRSQIYLGDNTRNLFADWALKGLLEKEADLFRGRRTLFHCAVATAFHETFLQAGARIEAADALLLGGVPILLKGKKQIELFLKGLKFTQWMVGNERLDPRKPDQPRHKAKFLEWVHASEVLVTYSSLLNQMDDFWALKGKIVVVDFLTPLQRRSVEAAEPALLVEFIPRHPSLETIRNKPLPVLTAALDQVRLAENSPLDFNHHALNWIGKLGVAPNRFRNSPAPRVRRCGFVIHPLSPSSFWDVPGLRRLKHSPRRVRGWIETAAARIPVFPYGRLEGAVSDSTGQEVICDLYVIPATPKQLLLLDEEFVYDRLVQAAELAFRRGALLFGLGAYTKVVGDAGVTVAKRAPLPVTTGNSYSVAATLWAARAMVEKLGLAPNAHSDKTMVIGATGSIGRVAALLLSLTSEQIVLVGPRIERLLEIQNEIRALRPETKVTLTSDANAELAGTNLIVTATSNQSGKILDIQRVRPGTVICDCSRPTDISTGDANSRPDILVIKGGEVDLPGHPTRNVDIGLPQPAVYACMAETILLTMEGRYEPFSLSREISVAKVKEIYEIGLKHGARISAIRDHQGTVTEIRIRQCRRLALERLRSWPGGPVELEKLVA